METVLAGIAAAEARRQALPGEWTIHEVVDHLVASHRPGLAELEALLAGRRPPGGPIPAGLQSPDPMARPWDELVGELRGLHTRILDTLAAAPEAPGEARAPVVMVVSAREPDGRTIALEWVEGLDWKAYAVVFRLHELDHMRQIEKTLRAVREAG
jgi:hypothetical protein